MEHSLTLLLLLLIVGARAGTASVEWVARLQPAVSPSVVAEIAADPELNASDCHLVRSVDAPAASTYLLFACASEQEIGGALVRAWRAAGFNMAAFPAVLLERNQVYWALGAQLRASSLRASAGGLQTEAVDPALDRVDQRSPLLNGRYAYPATGANVTIYVVDTGVMVAHEEFEGRAVFAGNHFADAGGNTDCNGHGTHVASLAAGRLTGVAKGASVRAIKVLGCEGWGTTLSVAAGLEQVRAECEACGLDCATVVNLSIGGGQSTLIDDAIAALIAACRVIVAAAAGNAASGACDSSPAASPGALTVAATVSGTDALASFSSYGAPCVRIAAPGVNVRGAWPTSPSAVAYLSGTSMATPLVAGVAALAFETCGGGNCTRAQAEALMLATATPSRVLRPAGAALPLVYSQLASSAAGVASLALAYSLLLLAAVLWQWCVGGL